MRGQAPKRRPTDIKKVCPHCGGEFNARGLGRHEQSCRSRQKLRQDVAAVLDVANGAGLPTNDSKFLVTSAQPEN